MSIKRLISNNQQENLRRLIKLEKLIDILIQKGIITKKELE